MLLASTISDQRERTKVNRAAARIGPPALPPCASTAQFPLASLVQIEPENCSPENSSSDSAGRPSERKKILSLLMCRKHNDLPLRLHAAMRDWCADCIGKLTVEQSNKATPIFQQSKTGAKP